MIGRFGRRAALGLGCGALLTAAAPVGTLRVGLPPAGDAAGALGRTIVAAYARATGQRPRIIAASAAGWDTALLDPVALDAACAAGRAAPIDWGHVGGRERLPAFAASDCGVGAALRATVLTWDTAHTRAAPGWGDFWNVARMPGQRGLPRSPMMTLEIALMADGVKPRDVYAVLGAPDGADRAFRKLDQLRPYIVWWRTPDAPMALVASGKVLMSAAPSDQVAAASRRLRRGFGQQWTGAVLSVQSWAIGGATRQVAAAEALIGVATDPQRQDAPFAATGLVAPAAVQAADGVPFDAGFWRAHGAALTARFNQWLAH